MKIDRSKYLFFTNGNAVPWGEHIRLVHALCDAYDALAADPRLSLVATTERPEGVRAVRICVADGKPSILVYQADEFAEADNRYYSATRWIAAESIYAAFPYVAPPDPRIAELAALKAKAKKDSIYVFDPPLHYYPLEGTHYTPTGSVVTTVRLHPDDIAALAAAIRR